MPISIKLTPGQRGALIGQTGTGKTLLADNYLIPKTGRLGYIDWKGESEFDAPVFETAWEIERRRPERFIYRPHTDELDDLWAFNRVYRYIYDSSFKGGPEFFVYIDELSAMLNKKFEAPPYFNHCYSRGRSRNITMLCGMQEPSRIPLVTLRAARRFYAFRLILPNDIKTMRGIIPGYNARPIGPKQIAAYEARYGYRPKVQFAFNYFDAETGFQQNRILEDPNHARR